MDRTKFSTIAHQDHVFYSPLSDTKADQLLGVLTLPTAHPVLDIGCGQAELLIRLCERYRVPGIGVDTNAAFIARAAAHARTRLQPDQLTLSTQPMSDYVIAPDSLAGVICIGATQAYGSYRQTLQATAPLVRSGGFALMGEPYWKTPPAPDYLALLGATGTEHTTHAETARLGNTAGWTLVYAAVSTDEEWDHYEGLYWRAVEQYVQQHPDDPDAAAMAQRSWHGRDLYLDHGRAAMGFGWYVYLRP